MSPSTEFVESVDKDAIVGGLVMACVALPCWLIFRHLRDHVKAKLDKVQSVAISNLRSFLDSHPNDTITTGRLVFVRGIVEAKANGCFSKNSSDDPDYFISESGEKAVALSRTVMKYFSKDFKDLFLPLSALRTRLEKFQQKYCWHRFYKVPFILVQCGEKPFLDYVIVNVDNDHLIPLETAYSKCELIDHSTTDILRPGEHGFPVCKRVEDRILPLGKHISVVGSCRYENGVPVISKCEDLHFFFTNCRSKSELVEEVSSQSETVFKTGLFFGMMALGFFSFAAVSYVY